MSKIALSLKIDVSKIDKARLFAGQKGTYLDATIFVDLAELDQYGNSGMITQDVSKEEKQQGVKGNILGNGKVFWVENGQAPQPQGQAQGGYTQQAPQQAQGGFGQQQVYQPQQAAPQQQNQARQQTNSAVQQNVNTNGSTDFDDSIPF